MEENYEWTLEDLWISTFWQLMQPNRLQMQRIVILLNHFRTAVTVAAQTCLERTWPAYAIAQAYDLEMALQSSPKDRILTKQGFTIILHDTLGDTYLLLTLSVFVVDVYFSQKRNVLFSFA